MSKLQGFSLPLSPEGTANLVPTPPWHYSGDMLIVEYRTDPDAVIALLPDELEPADDPGAVSVIFADWQSCTDEGWELLDPYYSQYKECMIFVGAKHQGQPVCRCVYIWVDKDFAMLRGWVQGFPKKMGEMWMIRPVTVGKAGPRLAPGGKLAATLAAGGRRLLDAKITLTGLSEKGPQVNSPALYNSRHFPRIDGTDPALHELVTLSGVDKEVSPIWEGTAELNFFDSPREELRAIAPKEIIGGFYHSYGYTFRSGQVIEQHGGKK